VTVALYAIQAAVLVGTVVSMRLCGPHGRWWGWHAAAANQVLWGPYIVLSGRWELAVTAVPLAVVFAGNAARSTRPAAASLPPVLVEAGWCSHGDHCTHHPKET
jgi:hypothetical protein